jgi:hypothetical protein
MKRLLFLTLSMALACCYGNNHPAAIKEYLQNDTSPKFKREIPRSPDGTFDSYYRLKRQREKRLLLDGLETGYDSLEIRIWFEYALYYKKDLVVIKRTDGKWTAFHYEITLDFNPDKETDSIKSKTSRHVTPKCGWDEFTDKLFSLKIMTLPNMDDIKEIVNRMDDGVDYFIEIATKNQYRFYVYSNPEEFEDKFWQTTNMTKIIELVRTELMSK